MGSAHYTDSSRSVEREMLEAINLRRQMMLKFSIFQWLLNRSLIKSHTTHHPLVCFLTARALHRQCVGISRKRNRTLAQFMLR